MTAASHPAWPPRFCLLLSFLLVALILSLPLEGTAAASSEKSNLASDSWHNASVSWGVGIVVRDGAPLAGGKDLSWGSSTNVSAVVHLPNITRPHGITYAILSAMGGDRSVFQVGLGVWPNCRYWHVYAWYITNVDSIAPTYQWMANSSTPQVSSDDIVLISILHRQTGWVFLVEDENTSSFTEKSFPLDPATSFAAGEQEVLSFESYTQSSQTFAEMGNMTLKSLFVDGQKIIGGWYTYAGWDGIHYPLFAVGSSNAPSFVRVMLKTDGTAVWNYDAQWTSEHLNSVLPFIVAIIGAIVLVPALALMRLAIDKRRELRRLVMQPA